MEFLKSLIICVSPRLLSKKSYCRQVQFSKTMETHRKEIEKNIMTKKILTVFSIIKYQLVAVWFHLTDLRHKLMDTQPHCTRRVFKRMMSFLGHTSISCAVVTTVSALITSFKATISGFLTYLQNHLYKMCFDSLLTSGLFSFSFLFFLPFFSPYKI